ncbi:hypothetical protein [Soonwooa sp.]|uniref:hypothetical protein n=1 Tax=Soonwooa sp. TaxID=1938592 RepID=UPI00261F0ADF|nr:hypothetical protein [Soonwooa sp.]
MFKKKFTIVLISFLLINCSKQEKAQFVKSEDFIRDWSVVRYPYSDATLSLMSNHNFSYSENGHMSGSFSEGTWQKKGDTLILNSNQQKDCFYLDDFSLNTKTLNDELWTSIKDCQPKDGSDFFTEFKNSKFIVKKDSLIYLDLNPDYKKQYGNYKIYKFPY